MSVILKGITWDHPRGYQPLVSCSAVYEKEFGVKIEWYKRSLTAFGDQSLEELSEMFDLLIIDHPHVGLARAKKCVTPLDDIISQENLLKLQTQSAGPSFLSYNYRCSQWALPIDAAMQSAVSKPDLISENDVPSNWNEVFHLAEDLKKANKYVAMALSPTDCLCAFLSLTAQAGSPIIEHKTNLVENDLGIHVLERLKKMKESFYPASILWSPIDLLDHMASNDDIAYCPLTFCYNNYSRNGFKEKELVFHDAPEVNNCVLGGAGIAISSSCKDKQVAGEFISWICSAAIQRTIYANQQGQPANLLAWKDENLNASTNNFFFNTIKTLENSFVRPRYNGWTMFQTSMGNIIYDFLTAAGSADLVLERLNVLYQQSKFSM